MRRLTAIWMLCLIGLAPAALAQEAIPERRLIITDNVDLPGADLGSYFDTTYEFCRNTCLGDAQCTAFTFNKRSNACFPKSQVGTAEEFIGAVSGEIVERNAADLALARTRAGELSFLDAEEIAAARAEALALADRHPIGTVSASELAALARSALANRNLSAALGYAGQALAISDTSELWALYSRASLAAGKTDRNDRFTLRRRAIPAAINGYLRADTDALRADALVALADALETADRGRDMIPVLRLAADLTASERIAARLDDAIGKFGFRISGTQVESDSAEPRICVDFNEELVQAGVDYAPFVQIEAPGLAVEASDARLCLDGVEHGQRYDVTFREGLPAASGETLAKSVTQTLYVRDRTSQVRFPGRGYVLPSGGPVAIPVVGVNAEAADLVLRRISDRSVIRAIQQDMFGRPISDYQQQEFATEISQEVWRGTAELARELNRDVTTRLPIGEAAGGLPPGIYALQASITDDDPDRNPPATQWFVVSDLGLTTLEGVDGLNVFVRSLATAGATESVRLTLVSRANAVLGEAVTDAEGVARFPAALTRGTAGSAPAMLVAETGAEDAPDDMAFLPLTDPEFDLSDRGVEGREPAGPVDIFAATDRGAYRAGDTIVATALVRDDGATALPEVPLTLILSRPDGVEWSRTVSTEGRAGGHVFRLRLTDTAPRGTWRLAYHIDPDVPPLATSEVLVEDFLPERIDAELTLPEGPLRLDARPPLTVAARYLFGAPAADLPVEADVRVSVVRSLADFPGYSFGRYDDPADIRSRSLDGVTTDAAGMATLSVAFPEMELRNAPLEAVFTVLVSEGSGRPIERQVTRALEPEGPLIGIAPEFDDVVPEGAEAGFRLIATGDENLPVRWTINRVETRYQWYSIGGRWNWDPITSRSRIATGEATLTGAPARVAAPVDWGQYEIVVERLGGGAPVSSSVSFYAGWYVSAAAADTPDTLDVSLDQAAYLPGDTARLRIVPRYAGTALVTVVSNRLIDMKAVEVSAGETVIDMPVTEDWGAGAYVTATVLRPGQDAGAGAVPEPARALGLAYASVDPGSRRLSARFQGGDEVAPRGPLEVALAVDGIAAGETAYATIAAVDLGILNLTGFASPDPSGYYFGQRKLGVGIRDLYGRLIDGNSGEMGRMRSGGDAEAGMSRQSPPPTQELVAYATGPVEVGADGVARATFKLPSFNGTVRLMAVVWSATGVGQAERDILVRDPVVVTATLPRFLAPGDTSRMLLEVVHATGPTGAASLSVSGAGVAGGTLPPSFDLTEGGKQVFSVPVMAGEVGDYAVDVVLTTPGGVRLAQQLTLPVRLNDPQVHRTSRFDLAAGANFTFDANVFDGFRAGTGRATLTAGAMAQFNTPGLLEALDRYPYGCTEQLTSRALPLLYLSDVAGAMGIGTRAGIDARLADAVTKVLANQSSEGGFGLWGPSSGDFWLDAYVTDFLSRARAAGVAVPDIAFRQALDNLRNRVNSAPDFGGGDNGGGEEIAYALYVLAREGAANVADLRYYADTKAADFGTPLALAQLGAALASYGDPLRADAMFSRAGRELGRSQDRAGVWRADYGTHLRDSAAVLTLAVEAGSNALDRDALTRTIAPLTGNDRRSTQEAVWTLLAANALLTDAPGGGLTVDGRTPDGLLVRVLDADTTAAPVVVGNATARPATLTVTTFGVPDVPEPAGGEGYSITRRYYTLEGEPADPGSVATGTRLVTVLEVRPVTRTEARLMVDDPLPAGFEIDNPNLMRSGDVDALDWLDTVENVTNAEFRSDRFLAQVDWRSDEAFRLAYIVRAVSPGRYHHPAASVEDMYRPRFRAHTATGRIEVTE
ncbi:alpha-2-macroglobulin family protein [Jannaschia pohangensis]|uniref:Apple domain-containing protein n=1 Tax=Jannaschia pohangensis TaxID=390807 RepID=A0A1I3UGX8_9RHOB|nr:alpha-2-macroglobulin family protein [Jannaschia pohangensis]SFJ82734.1 hypothetical protein SAMN04488095_3763 [Jannaschia pohangensis]